MNDDRRSTPRHATPAGIEVTDSLRGEAIGRIGNLSSSGMLLIGPRSLRDDALYQVHFRLPQAAGPSIEIATGVQTMWTSPAATSGYRWSGLRIISISAEAVEALSQWLENVAV